MTAAAPSTPADRQDYLAAACGSDRELRAEMESILSAAERAPALVERPAIESLEPGLVDESELSLVGKRFGVYQIVRGIAARVGAHDL